MHIWKYMPNYIYIYISLFLHNIYTERQIYRERGEESERERERERDREREKYQCYMYIYIYHAQYNQTKHLVYTIILYTTTKPSKFDGHLMYKNDWGGEGLTASHLVELGLT